MANLRQNIDRLKLFLTREIWELDPTTLSRSRFLLLRPLRISAFVIRDFIADRCLLRASALTYTTLLSIVPLLAMMVAVLKGLGVQNTLEPLILEKIAVGTEEVVGQIIGYINNTNMARLGVFGFCTLFLTVLALLSNIEKSFNHIWGVTETRSIMRRFADYFSVVTFGPVLVVLAISMTSTLQSMAFMERLEELAYVGEALLFLFKIGPFVGMWIAFTALYLFMPNCKVTYRAAMIGGIFGGTLWQLAQWGYVHFQVGVARYNAIYGTMAALPILMVWIYLSWLIVLLGLELAYAWQNLRLVPNDIRGEEVNFSSREQIALTVMLVIGEAYSRGERNWDISRISTELDLPPRLAKDVLGQLVDLGFLSEVRDGEAEKFAYQPGRSPDTLQIHALLEGLKKDGVDFTRLRPTPQGEVIRELEAHMETAGQKVLGSLTLHDLVQRMTEKKGREA
ncbi:hypothetical protein DESUT3_26690 [Desulfuromonas versatilis]|uniref:tRNA-processing RNAse BN n=1 Tax=Desulfuromonas versatilis TaxID=2802975 RepID=A0ABM8HRA4_9BACT|nr:YihY/virulence factor BrkB family protein [Desulfuromonas versatilis]BCR05600.1 hypothetical protein DESUT3_26690 [Desulfuromonas versatilis]